MMIHALMMLSWRKLIFDMFPFVGKLWPKHTHYTQTKLLTRIFIKNCTFLIFCIETVTLLVNYYYTLMTLKSVMSGRFYHWILVFEISNFRDIYDGHKLKRLPKLGFWPFYWNYWIIWKNEWMKHITNINRTNVYTTHHKCTLSTRILLYFKI